MAIERTEHSSSSQTKANFNCGDIFWDCIEDFPIEASTYAVAGLAVRVFSPTLSYPLLGISAGLLGAKLVLKILDCYDSQASVRVTKEACKLNNNNSQLQLIGFIFAMAISGLSHCIAFITGFALGGYSAVLLDVENYKRAQQANRREGFPVNI